MFSPKFPTLALLFIVYLLAAVRTAKTTTTDKVTRVLGNTAGCLDDDGITSAIEGWFSDRKNATIDYGPIGNWATCEVTNFRGLFLYKALFNGDLSAWDVARATNMHRMFMFASTFNGDLRGWDISAVLFFNQMFDGASSFNRCLEWDVSKKYTTDMFTGSDGRISESCPCLDCFSNIGLRGAVGQWFLNRTVVKAKHGQMTYWRTGEVN